MLTKMLMLKQGKSMYVFILHVHVTIWSVTQNPVTYICGPLLVSISKDQEYRPKLLALGQCSSQDWFCILPKMKKSIALFHIKNFSCHVTLATFKKKSSTCGSQVDHMWVTSRLFHGSVGQMGQQE